MVHNLTEYSVMIYTGKESEKEHIYVYVKLNYFAVSPEANITL